MPEVVYTFQAQSDLMDVGFYSQEKFGTVQRDLYLDGLAARAIQVAVGVAHRRDISDIRSGVSMTTYKSHAIYFRELGSDDIEILRILHQSMDAARHL